MARLTADFTKPTGRKVRPLHGMNSGPMTKVFTYDAREWFKDAGFPYARFHDVEYPYGSGEFVDIHCLFKDFDKDENDPANYNFGLTDLYVGYCMEVGSEPLYRLGESIEHAPVKLHIFPPKDYEKWARICEHIIAHYTEGWADGFRYPIKYWEIWNEADGGSRNMWQGTPEEFYEFYAVTARCLKKRFPNLKIGGGAFTRAYNEFTEGFLRYISSQKEYVPLDFYSWHRYFAKMEKLTDEARKAREMLVRYGYPDAISILDEWNYMEDWANQPESYRVMKDHRGAAFNAAVLAALQTKTDVAIACQFEADVVKEFCDVFNVKDMRIGNHGKAELEPTKSYYAFKSFNELYKLKNEVVPETDDETIYALGAVSDDGSSFGLLIANYGTDEKTLDLALSGVKRASVRRTDKDETFRVISNEVPERLALPPYSFVFVGNTL